MVSFFVLLLLYIACLLLSLSQSMCFSFLRIFSVVFGLPFFFAFRMLFFSSTFTNIRTLCVQWQFTNALTNQCAYFFFFFTYFVWLARCGVYGAVICLPAIATMLCFAMTFFLSFSQPLSSLFMHRHTFVQLHTYVDNGLIQHIHIIPCRTHTYNSREVHQQQRLKTKQREKKHNFLVPYVCLRIAREKKMIEIERFSNPFSMWLATEYFLEQQNLI